MDFQMYYKALKFSSRHQDWLKRQNGHQGCEQEYPGEDKSCRKTKLMIDRDVNFLEMVKIEKRMQNQNLKPLRRLRSLKGSSTADEVAADNLGSFGASPRNGTVYYTAQSN
ncbi:hypothetical protein WISP_24069 [Willisornis vidua]|uniref:Uncharacterized protein n=1 Tax=Willisornis vidua TaxID=1566151 RepID=A0ABQ9DSH5_9PASS|nr:hypothetical protein WISP_24069 [Willisornis vidua]